MTLLQANLNHACQTQNIFLHTLAEHGCAVGVISEPYRVPARHPCWVKDWDGTIAITWRNVPISPACFLVESKKGAVVVDWGNITIISIYISPNITLVAFEE